MSAPTNPALRPELGPLPERMKSLPVHRGYPVPWFVAWEPNEAGELEPEFRAIEAPKRNFALRRKVCWVCGERLGSHLAFVIGPMCGITRVSSEPACHLDCALWSAKNCPFLSRPDMTRRGDIVAEYPGALQPPGIHLDRNPGVSLVWVCRDYELFSDGKGGTLLHLGDPEAVSFWSQGRPATRAEIDKSVESGLPLLFENEKGLSAEVLQKDVIRFQQLLPAYSDAT